MSHAKNPEIFEDGYLSTFTDEELQDIRTAYKSSGLTDSEIQQNMNDAKSVLETIEDPYNGADNINSVREYIDSLFDSENSEYTADDLRHLPVLMTYEDDIDPFDIGAKILGYGSKGEKPVEYLIRSKPVWEDNVSDKEADSIMKMVLNYVSTAAGSENSHYRISSQYLSLIQGKDNSFNRRINDLVDKEERNQARAAASTSLEELNENTRKEAYGRFDEAEEIEGIKPRLRGLRRALACPDLEKLHRKTFIDGSAQPTKNTILLSMDGDLIGSWKREGDNSILGLRDAKEDGRYTLRKGWAYESTYELWQNIEETEEQNGWDIVEINDLPVNPIRQAGLKGDSEADPEWFREKIDEQVEEIEKIL